MRLLRAACRGGVAGVVVTHDAQLASWADRIVFLRDGRIVDQTHPTPGRGVAPHRAMSNVPANELETSRSGRRPVVRWALRLLRREWRQHILVIALLTVAVAAALFATAAAYNVGSNPAADFGNATHRIMIDPGDPAASQTLVADATSFFEGAEVVAETQVPIRGSTELLTVRSQDPAVAARCADARTGRRTLSRRGLRGSAHRRRGVDVERRDGRHGRGRRPHRDGGRHRPEPVRLRRRVRARRRRCDRSASTASTC